MGRKLPLRFFSNVERISSAILHLHFRAIFELIRRSNASIVTENKFEKSRKGRWVNRILLAHGKIAEVIFSTLLRLEIHIQFEIFKNFAGRIIVALRLAKNCLALS